MAATRERIRRRGIAAPRYYAENVVTQTHQASPGWTQLYDLLIILAIGAGMAGVIAGVIVTLTDDDSSSEFTPEIPQLFRQQAVPADDLLVVIELLPGEPGVNELSILVRDTDSAPITPEAVNALITTPDGSARTVELTAVHAPEHYVADDISLPAGTAEVQVQIEREGQETAVGVSSEEIGPSR